MFGSQQQQQGQPLVDILKSLTKEKLDSREAALIRDGFNTHGQYFTAEVYKDDYSVEILVRRRDPSKRGHKGKIKFHCNLCCDYPKPSEKDPQNSNFIRHFEKKHSLIFKVEEKKKTRNGKNKPKNILRVLSEFNIVSTDDGLLSNPGRKKKSPQDSGICSKPSRKRLFQPQLQPQLGTALYGYNQNSLRGSNQAQNLGQPNPLVAAGPQEWMGYQEELLPAIRQTEWMGFFQSVISPQQNVFGQFYILPQSLDSDGYYVAPQTQSYNQVYVPPHSMPFNQCITGSQTQDINQCYVLPQLFRNFLIINDTVQFLLHSCQRNIY